jgi:hypothetical protein
MNQRPESKPERAEQPLKDLELNKETVQELTEGEAEAGKGGYLVPPPRTQQLQCMK